MESVNHSVNSWSFIFIFEQGGGDTDNSADEDPEKLRRELEEIKRQAEEFREQLKQKDKDLEEYKKALGEISDKSDSEKWWWTTFEGVNLLESRHDVQLHGLSPNCLQSLYV